MRDSHLGKKGSAVSRGQEIFMLNFEFKLLIIKCLY